MFRTIKNQIKIWEIQRMMKRGEVTKDDVVKAVVRVMIETEIRGIANIKDDTDKGKQTMNIRKQKWVK